MSEFIVAHPKGDKTLKDWLRDKLRAWLGIDYLRNTQSEYLGHIITIRDLQFALAELVRQRELTIAALEQRIATLEPKVTIKSKSMAAKKRAK